MIGKCDKGNDDRDKDTTRRLLNYIVGGIRSILQMHMDAAWTQTRVHVRGWDVPVWGC